jgi:4-amino-4-deoxychorismate lyase
MSLLFESICVLNGRVLNPKWHELRYHSAYSKLFGESPKKSLLAGLQIPIEFQTGKVKLKIIYGQNQKEFSFQLYKIQKIETLKIVHHNKLDYSLKYSERQTLNELFTLRENCDDVLIVKNGEITDTSYGNVIFFDGANWITPKNPLLKGTCRARLISDGKAKKKAIRVEHLKSFKGVKVINAMRDLEQKMIPIENIIL